MGRRGKVVFARIADEKKRKESLRKRKAGLLKKMSELTILCGMEAAVVVCNREDSEPTVWPSKEEAKATINKFLDRSEVERKSRSHNTKSLFAQKCKRLKNKAERLKERNDRRILQAQITSIYDGKIRIEDLDAEQRKKLSDFADKRKEELQKHVKRLKRKEQQGANQAQAGASGQTNIGGVMQHNLSSSSFMRPTAPFSNPIQAPYPDQALPMVSQWPSVYQPASGISINNLTDGEIVSSPAATTQGQLMNDQGMTQLDHIPLSLSLPTPYLIVMSHDTSEGNRLNMNETFCGGVMQHNLPCPSFMGPAARVAYPNQAQYPDQAPPLVRQWPSVHQPASGLNINDLADGGIISSPAAITQGQLMNYQGMKQIAPTTLSLSLPTPDLIVMSHNTSAGNGLDMTERFYGQTNIGRMMQHPRPSPAFRPPPEPFSISNVQSMTRGLNSTNDGLINGSGLNSTSDGFINAGTRTLTGDGHFNEIIQLASPPSLPLELPRRLGLPTVPPVQHDASGRDMLSKENSENTTISRESRTAFLDESSFDAEYWNAIEFPQHAILCLNQSNNSNGTNNGMYEDLDAALVDKKH
ncbi:hypothetical protein AgCh_030352 [Apium graveolens]